MAGLEIRGELKESYPDVYTDAALDAMAALALLNADRRRIMAERIERRRRRAQNREPIAFLDPVTSQAT